MATQNNDELIKSTTPRRASIFNLKGKEEQAEDFESLDQEGENLLEKRDSPINQAEIFLIGALLAQNSTYNLISEDLSAEDFSEDATKAVFSAISRILDGQEEGLTFADALTVSEMHGISRFIRFNKLKAWETDAALGNLDDSQILSYASIILNAANNRRLATAISQGDQVLIKNISAEEKAETLVGLIESSSRQPSKAKSGAKRAGAFGAMAVLNLVDRAKSGRTIRGIEMGMGDLDILLSGLNDTDLVIVAARPAVGKTAFVLSALKNITKRGIPAYMCSMEMPGDQLASRVLSMISNVDAEKCRSATLSASDWDQYLNAQEELDTYPLYFNDKVDATVAAVRKEAIRLHKECGIKLIVIDYLQLMTGDSKLNREALISSISRELKKLALELKIPVVALSQLNRNIENRVDKAPKLADLRESGAIEQDADVIVFLHEEDPKRRLNGDLKMIDAIVAKQRSGPIGTVPLAYNPRITEYGPLP